MHHRGAPPGPSVFRVHLDSGFLRDMSGFLRGGVAEGYERELRNLIAPGASLILSTESFDSPRRSYERFVRLVIMATCFIPSRLYDTRSG